MAEKKPKPQLQPYLSVALGGRKAEGLCEGSRSNAISLLGLGGDRDALSERQSLGVRTTELVGGGGTQQALVQSHKQAQGERACAQRIPRQQRQFYATTAVGIY